MGLLEAFGLGSGDPDKDAAINHGLLVAGASLLGSRGRLSPNIGNAILQGLQGAQQFSQQGMQQRQAGMQQQLTQAQLDKLKADQAAEAARRAEEEARKKQVQTFIQGIPSPEMRASQQALAPGGGPTVQNAQRMQPVDPNQSMMYGMLQNGLISPQDYFAAQNKQQAPVKLGQGEQLLDPTTYKPLATNPKQAAENSFIAQMREAGIDPASAEGQSLLRQRLLKEASHAPAATAISYGSPVPVALPGGGVGYAQPGNRPGAAPQMMVGPDGKPLVKPEEEKPLTEGQAKAVQFASRMQSAHQTLAQLDRRGVSTSVPGAMGNNMLGSAITAMSPADQQLLTQAKRDFINAALRRESGAVISADEFANAERQYFPQVGDSEEVKKQKARNRRTAIEGIKADVPAKKRPEVDRISGQTTTDDDPLGLRGGR